MYLEKFTAGIFPLDVTVIFDPVKGAAKDSDEHVEKKNTREKNIQDENHVDELCCCWFVLHGQLLIIISYNFTRVT